MRTPAAAVLVVAVLLLVTSHADAIRFDRSPVKDPLKVLEGKIQALDAQLAAVSSRLEAAEAAVLSAEERAISAEERATRAENRATSLESAFASLASRVASTEETAASWSTLAEFVSVDEMPIDPIDAGPMPRFVPVVRFAGCNVQLVPSEEAPWEINGAGNLILGELDPLLDGGELAAWGARHGSSNLILGPTNDWTGAHGIVQGRGNAIHGSANAVLGADGVVAEGACNGAVGTVETWIGNPWTFIGGGFGTQSVSGAGVLGSE